MEFGVFKKVHIWTLFSAIQVQVKHLSAPYLVTDATENVNELKFMYELLNI